MTCMVINMVDENRNVDLINAYRLVVVLLVVVVLRTLLKKAYSSLNTGWIWLKLGMNILDISPHRRSEPDF